MKRPPCKHLGSDTGGTVRCSPCGGNVRVKLFGCALLTECTLTAAVPGIACCRTCPKHEPAAGTGASGEAVPGVRPAPVRAYRWSYGVTTVTERRDTLLPQTLASLKAAGWDNPRLFVDGVNGGFDHFGLPVTYRDPAVRTHANWVLSLYELYLRDPEAERFMVAQDDLVAVRNLRAYLDRCPYPDGPANRRVQPGYWNLYTSPSNQSVAPASGWFQTNQLGKGAVALVFSREAVLTLLSGRHLVERPLDRARGWRAVDGGIVDTMKKAGWCEYAHSPSLVKHTGKVSTLDKSRRGNGKGQYVWPDEYDVTSFPGEDFDALTLLDVPHDKGWWQREAEALRRAILEDRQRLEAQPERREHFARLIAEYEGKLAAALEKAR